MNSKVFAWIYFVLGLVLTVSSILFAHEPIRYLNPGLPINGNIGYGCIALAIIAAGCFISSAVLMKNKSSN